MNIKEFDIAIDIEEITDLRANLNKASGLDKYIKGSKKANLTPGIGKGQ